MKLVAHASSTLGNSLVVNDVDMGVPENWREHDMSKSADVGHQPNGKTVCLHSFAVDPKFKGRGLGQLAMKSFLKAMEDKGSVDRVALLCQKDDKDDKKVSKLAIRNMVGG
jgi:GNAT superfamily N-acetyltransferase